MTMRRGTPPNPHGRDCTCALCWRYIISRVKRRIAIAERKSRWHERDPQKLYQDRRN